MGNIYESAVKGRRLFRQMYRDQKKRADRYGVALMMIREGCDDPKGLAARILAEDQTSPAHPDAPGGEDLE